MSMPSSGVIAKKAKAKGKSVLEDVEEPGDSGKGSNVIDLMAALKKSVDGRKRPQPKRPLRPKKARPKKAAARASAPDMARAADPLAEYNAKRDFKRTPSPPARCDKPGGNRFIVQKHDATRLHCDLRLEIDGVLKSWAVTKGPSARSR